MHALPHPPFAPGSRVIVLEAAPGTARREHLAHWLEEAGTDAAASWLLPCGSDREGMWGGLNTWMRALLPRLEAEAPDLFRRHDTELCAVIPELRLRVRPRHLNLTDDARKDEGVRNWAQDRAYRIPHGIVDLLDDWHERTGGGRWVLACDGFDGRGGLAGHFFRQLVRRRGAKLGLQMLVAVDPGNGDAVAAEMAAFAPVERVRLDLPGAPGELPDPAAAARDAQALEALVGIDSMMWELHMHEIIRLWTAAGRTDRMVDWHARALGLFAHLGYYEDAYRHLPFVRDHLDVFDAPDAFDNRAHVVSNLRILYITNGRPDEALRVMETEGLAWITDPMDRVHALYVVSMLHARHLPVRDMDKAEHYLGLALAEVDRAGLDPADHAFQTGFLLNGLAYVRFRQGDAGMAAELSHQNFERLDESLPPERHRLHRSVLLYNAGQVYGQTGDHNKAVEYFTAAMEMDPNYSEYYNDRGTILQKLGRFDEAEQDYHRAIELSPPYPEVWFNLGQCYTRSGRPAQAESAYLRALDLDPARAEAWVNLARARHALGRPADALAAYDAAIAADGRNPFVLANRAGLRLELGRAHDALEDLDRALALAPENPALQRNRIFVLQSLERTAPATAAA